MRTVLQGLKTLAVALFWFGAAYAIFFYVAHFNEIQSVVLAIVGWCAIGSYRLAIMVAGKQQPQFEPYWVSIEPNWYSICNDFGLAAGEEWTELQERCKNAPTND